MVFAEIFFQSTGLARSYAHGWYLLLFLGLTLACASFTFRYIEKPGKRWLHAFFKPAVSV